MSGGRERARLQGPGLPWWCSSWDFTPSAGGLGATPGQGSRWHISQLQIPSDTAKTQHSQTKNNLKTRLQGLRRHTGRGQTAPHAPAVRGLPSCPSHWGADLSCTGGRRPVLVLSGAVHATALWARETHTQSSHCPPSWVRGGQRLMLQRWRVSPEGLHGALQTEN